MSEKTEFIINLTALHASMLKRIDRHLSVHGISYSEFLVLYHLDNAPNHTMRRIDLADQIGMSASGVTRLLNPMEKNRLVEKEQNARDARVSLIKLSKSGERVFQMAAESFEESAKCVLRSVNPKQLTRLSELMSILANK